MFSSLETLLQKANASEVHFVLAKYFTDNKSMPKDFLKNFPEFQDIIQIFEFNHIETKVLKKAIINITDKQQINDIFSDILPLKNPITENEIEIFKRITSLTISKTNKRSVGFLFRTAIRIFARLVYQIPQILNNVLDQNQDFPIVLENLDKILLFFNLYNGNKFANFHKLLTLFLNHFSFRFDDILHSETNLKEICLKLMSILVKIANTYLKYNPGSDSPCITFITEQFDKIAVIMDESKISKQIAVSIKVTFATLVPSIELYSEDQKHSLSMIALTLLNGIMKMKGLDTTEIYQTCMICLKLYNESSKFENKIMQKFQFTPIILFIIWLITTCTDVSNEDIQEVPPEIPQIKELGVMDKAEYFNNNKTISDAVHLVLSRRLSTVAETILSICKHFKDPSPFVANLIESIKEHKTETNPEQFRTFVAFVLFLIAKIPENIVNNAVNNNWSLLLSPIIFPYDTSIPSDTRLRDTVLNIVLRTFIIAPESRKIILDAISNYFQNNIESGMRYFLQFLNSLLIVADTNDFVNILSSSPLLDLLISFSNSNLIAFDFLRICTLQQPQYILNNQDFVNFILDHIEDDTYQDSVFRMIDIGFSLTGRDPDFYPNIGIFMKYISKHLLKIDIEYSLKIVELAIYGKVEIWPEKFLESTQLRQFIDTSSMLCVEHFSNDCFMRLIKLYNYMITVSPNLFYFMTQPDLLIYTNLKQAALKRTEESDEITSLLFDLAYASKEGTKNSHVLLRNYKAIEVLMQWTINSSKEKEILLKLSRLSMKSTSNVYQLNCASVSEHILQRLEKVGDDLPLISELLQLLSQLSRYAFTNSVLYAAIKLMRSKNFIYPNLILSTFFRLITDDAPPGPSCFFHFDGTASGIFGPIITLEDQSVFSTSLRIDNSFGSSSQPIIVYDSKPQQYALFSVVENRIVFNSTNFNSTNKYTSKSTFDTGKWFFICIQFTLKNVNVYINGSLEIQAPGIPLATQYKISIGALSDSMKEIGLIGDIGPSYLVRTNDIQQLKLSLMPTDAEKIFGKDLLLMYSPRSTQQNRVLNVSTYSPSIPFRGQAIPFISTINDILSSVAALPNLIPIIQRMCYCEHCNCYHETPCEYCNSVSTPNGIETIVTLLQIITMLLQNSQANQLSFITMKGYRLICGFLSRSSPYFIESRILKCLIDLFVDIKNDEIGQQAVEDFFFNFDFLTKLQPDVQNNFYSKLIYKAFKENPKPFASFATYDFIIYRTIALTESKSPLAEHVWQFLTTFFSTYPTPQLCASLIAILSNTKDTSIVEPLLDILLLLIECSTDAINNAINAFDYYLPFAFPMAIPSPSIHSKILQIIQTLKHPNHISFNEFVLLSIISYDKEANNSDSIDQHTVINRLSRMLYVKSDSQTKIDCGQFLPLYVTIIKTIPKEYALKSIQSFFNCIMDNNSNISNLSLATNWYYWIFDLLLFTYDFQSQLSEIISHLVVIFKKLISNNSDMINDFSDFLTFLDIQSFDMDYDFSSIKKALLLNIFKHDIIINDDKLINNFDILFKEAFKYIFLHTSIGKRKDTTNDVPQIFQDLLPKQKYVPDSLDFNIQIDQETNKWKDLDLAEVAVSFVPYVTDMEFSLLDNTKYDVISAAAYINSYIIRYDKDFFINSLEGFTRPLKLVGYDAAYISSSILYFTILKHGVDYNNVDKILYYVKNYEDSEDSPDLRYFLFEDSIGSSINLHLTKIIDVQKSLIQKMLGNIESALSIKDITQLKQPKEGLTPIEQIISVSKPHCYIPLKGAYERFWIPQKNRLEVDRLTASKHLNSFLRELSLGGGPWAEKRTNEHFKSSDYTSLRGNRVLLTINHNFDDHKKASELRDSGKSDAKAAIIIPRFKPTSGTVIIRHEGYRAQVQKISLHCVYNGEISIVNNQLHFDGKNTNEPKHMEINLSSIEFILNRKQNYQDVACELFINDCKSYYFVFSSPEERVRFYKTMSQICITKPEKTFENKFYFFSELRRAENGKIQVSPSSEIIKKIHLTEKWSSHIITNYEYLYYLNLLAGRSFNDLSQYPVYPWILKDYESELIGLQSPNIYRDLSKPIGALNEKRLALLKEIYKDYPDPSSKCLYRSHFSSMAAVSSFLIRVEPFTSLHIALQEGRFDVPERLFSSILIDWKSVTSEEMDFRELIPEFFSFVEFLQNNSHYDLGKKRMSNEIVNDVILPTWATSPWHFIVTNRQALENEITSQNIHKWIDLIFGVNRCSEQANNVFHPLSYPEKERGPEVLPEAIHNHCVNFGICPDQIFNEPHIQRAPFEEIQPIPPQKMQSQIVTICKGFVFLDDGSYFNLKLGTQSMKKLPGTFGDIIGASTLYSIGIFRQRFDSFVTAISLDTNTVKTISHDAGAIRSATIIGGMYLITGGTDCSIRIWELPTFQQMRISSMHSDPIIALSGCMENGTVASLDKSGLLIVETLRKGKFICSIEISIHSNTPTLLSFKSGLVVVADQTNAGTILTTFDAKLSKIAQLDVPNQIYEIHKFSDGQGGEYIAAALESSFIIYEAYSLRTIISNQTNNETPHIYPQPCSHLVYYSEGDLLKTFHF